MNPRKSFTVLIIFFCHDEKQNTRLLQCVEMIVLIVNKHKDLVTFENCIKSLIRQTFNTSKVHILQGNKVEQSIVLILKEFTIWCGRLEI